MTTELGFTYKPIEVTDDTRPPDRFLILKDGDCDLAGFDMKLTQADADRLLGQFAKQGSQLPIDYHHATLRAETRDGTQAPAAGWIRSLEYIPDEGIYAKDVEWTEQASKAILSKEFKYHSPVVRRLTETGELLFLHSVALTNRPAKRDLKELLEAADRAAGDETMADKAKTGKTETVAGQEEMLEEVPSVSITPEQEATVKLKMILVDKGATLDENASVADIMNAAIDALGGDAEEGDAGGESEEVAASLVAGALGCETKDWTTMTKEIAKLKAVGAQYGSVTQRLEAAEGKLETIAGDKAKADAETRVQFHVDAGRILPDDDVQMAAARKLANSDLETFEDVYGSLAVVCPPGRTVTIGAGGSNAARTKSIDKAKTEFATDPQVGQKPDRLRHYVAASLDEEGLTPLTPDEIKKLEGGA